MDSDALDLEPSATPVTIPGTQDETPRRRRRPLRPAIVLLVTAAFGLNLMGLAVVAWTLRTTKEDLEAKISNRMAEPVASAGLETGDVGEVGDLLDIALRLEQHGEREGAKRVRAAARAMLIEREGEDGAFVLAVRLLEQGRARDARRAFYQILARADQPGTRWGELAIRSRFLVGETLSAEADEAEAPAEGDS